MNANVAVPTTAHFRINRIQKVSRYIRLFLLYGLPVGLIAMPMAGCFMAHQWGWGAAQLNSPQNKLILDEMNSVTGHLWLLSVCVLFLVWYRTMLKLFGFFERGVLFTPETVRCIQTLGGVYTVKFFVTIFFNFYIPDFVADIGLGYLLAGLSILFIGWLIDEARKIREDQELTV